MKAIAIEDWENPAHCVDFLTHGCSQLIHLWINTADIPDLSPVSGLYNLEKLVVAPTCERQPIREKQITGIDFSRLLRLRECVLANVASLGNLADCVWLEELLHINSLLARPPFPCSIDCAQTTTPVRCSTAEPRRNRAIDLPPYAHAESSLTCRFKCH